MNGSQRVGLVIICILAVMICFPDYSPKAAWSFAGIIFAVWVGVIMVLSVVLGLFGLDKFEFVNRMVSFLLLAAVMYSLLCYFPQDTKPSPLDQLKSGIYPNSATLSQGLKQLTFNFDFVHRNVHNSQNFVNQKVPQEAAPVPAPQPAPRKAGPVSELEIEVED